MSSTSCLGLMQAVHSPTWFQNSRPACSGPGDWSFFFFFFLGKLFCNLLLGWEDCWVLDLAWLFLPQPLFGGFDWLPPILGAGFRQVTNLFATMWSPALYNHHQLSLSKVDDIWDRLEAVPFRVDFEGIVAIRCPQALNEITSFTRLKMLRNEVRTCPVRSVETLQTDANPTGSSIFVFQSVILCDDVFLTQLCRLLFCGQ